MEFLPFSLVRDDFNEKSFNETFAHFLLNQFMEYMLEPTN